MLPALIWVLVGSVVMGAVHDFGAVVMSLRNKGVSIADLTGSVICRRARVLLLAVVFFELLIVVAIFALVIASVFALYPHSVIPVWLEFVFYGVKRQECRQQNNGCHKRQHHTDAGKYPNVGNGGHFGC